MRSFVKKILPKVLPKGLYFFLRKEWIYYKATKNAILAYRYDMKRYVVNSALVDTNSAQKLISKIIREYHVIEKGLTMPETRVGFGKGIILDLCNDCLLFLDKYDNAEEQLIHAIHVLLEYEKFHQDQNYQLDEEVLLSINHVKSKSGGIICSAQIEMTKDEYFSFTEHSFPEFSKSRSSVRNYSSISIPEEKIIQALEIARSAPSACNRQCWRTYLFNDKDQIRKILEIQGGNRGFGHLTDKLIVIAAETGVFSNIGERNQAFIDGGMYAMNLLYALHYQKVAACILNCSNTVDKDKNLRMLCGIKDSEVFIAMISCGIPPERFKIAVSKRYNLNRTHTTV